MLQEFLNFAVDIGVMPAVPKTTVEVIFRGANSDRRRALPFLASIAPGALPCRHVGSAR